MAADTETQTRKETKSYVLDSSNANRSGEKGMFVTFYADLRGNSDKFFLFARLDIDNKKVKNSRYLIFQKTSKEWAISIMNKK